MGPPRAGVVSVVLVNYRGAEDTLTCLRGFADVDWPADALELIVVDNASGDGSVERIRTSAPGARLLASATNTGFAGGCNRGVRSAAGEYVAFLNNDARPGRDWLRSAVAVLERDASVACVASKILDWEGKTVDYVDASLAFFGHGYKRESKRADSPEYDKPQDVLFASGAAMVVRADVFREVGGFDERFFMFFEDVDFGWRLWLLGHRVRYEPLSVAYHRHHATVGRFGPWREHYLLERNALFTIYKNYDDDTLARVLPAAMALAIRRGISQGGDDPSVLDLARSTTVDEADTLGVSKLTLAPAYAVDAFVEALPDLTVERRRLQAARRRSDQELFRLFRQPLEPIAPDPRYLAGYAALVEAFGIAERFSGRRKIVVATGDALTPKMAGPAIRAWHVAAALSVEHDVELVTTTLCTVEHPRFRCRVVTGKELQALEQWCDVFFFQGFIMAKFPWLRDSGKVIVVDIYDPFHLEQLEQAKDQGEPERTVVVRNCVATLNQQLLRGDYFLCASEKQRDFWLGQLASLGRVNPLTYDVDETLESLIAVAPFGLSETAPVHTRAVLKGVVEGIGLNDKVILWGGGIYNWFDPLTLLHAVDKLRHRRPDVRLFFLGLRHPNPDVPEMRMAVAARNLSDSLGLTGRYAFFNAEWVRYDDRQSYLLEADIGVSTHLDHVETAFSFRTRMLDYLWASLPIVATRGDTLAELVERERLGLTAPAGDVDALEEALFRLLDDDGLAAECRKNIAAIAPTFSWSNVLAPLVAFCREPHRAPDLLLPELALDRAGQALAAPVRLPGGWRQDVALVRSYLREGGPSLVVRRATTRLRRRGREVAGVSRLPRGAGGS